MVGFPAVGIFESRLRICISASHSKKELDYTLNAIKEISQEIKLNYAKNPTQKISKEVNNFYQK